MTPSRPGPRSSAARKPPKSLRCRAPARKSAARGIRAATSWCLVAMISASLSDMRAGKETRCRKNEHGKFVNFDLFTIAAHVESPRRVQQRGRSSVVERHLAKVDVVSSNLIARSILISQPAAQRVFYCPDQKIQMEIPCIVSSPP